VILVKRANRAHRVSMELKVLLDHRVLLDSLELLAYRVSLEKMAYKVILAYRVP